MEELGVKSIPAKKPRAAAEFAPFGKPVTPGEVAARLSGNLYGQLSDGSDESVKGAISRACIYAGAVLRRLGAPFNLNDKVVREVVLIHAIYELHIALGHEEAGREYRAKARDIIRAAWGDFPEAGSGPERGAAAAVAAPKKKGGGFR